MVKTATMRFQYSSLNCSDPSTRMNRIGRFGSTLLMTRCTCSMLAVEAPMSGGMNLPSSRKDRALFMRRSDEAEGERRMMGSGRRDGPLGLRERDWLEVMADEDCSFLWMNGAASFRTWEKSYVEDELALNLGVWGTEFSLLSRESLTVGLTPRRTVLRSPILRSPSYTLASLGSKEPLPDLA